MQPLPVTIPPGWSRCPFCGSQLDPTQTACPQCGAAPSAAVTVGYDDRRPTTPEELQTLETELRTALAPRLQLLRLLGQGGMGSVFLARDPALRRLVVVKVLSPSVANDLVARARFAREAETAASVAHPNVVHVYQVGTLDRSATTYFTMQFVDGPTLEQAYPAGTPVPEPVAKRIVGEIASALAAAHARDLIHRDIKPANVMIDRESGRAMVLDFGISAAKGPVDGSGNVRATVEGMVVGTPTYMSPEQAAGEPTTDRSDIYCLGVVAFEMVTGAVPFTAKTPMALAAAHLRDIPPAVAKLRPETDPQFAALIDRCLSKKPAARPTAESIARYLAPPAQAHLEWPPPGLDELHRYGWGHLRWLTVALLIGMLGLTLLAEQPASATGQWRNGPEGIWVFLGSQGSEAFGFLLILLIITPTLLVLGVFARSVVLAARLRRGRRSGYPWPVLIDVAFDHGDHTAAVMNRQGPFALLDLPARARLLRRRRAQLLCTIAALVLGVLGPWLWWKGHLPVDPEDSFSVVSRSALALIFLLPGIPMLGAALLGLEEWTIVGQARRRSPTLLPARMVRPEVAEGWLKAAERPPDRRPVLPFLPGLLGVIASVALVVIVIVALASAFPVYVNTSSAMGRYDRETAESFLRQYRTNRPLILWWPRASAALERVRPPATLPTAAGVTAARRLLKIGIRPPIASALAVDTASGEELERRFLGVSTAGFNGDWWASAPGGLPPGAGSAARLRAGSARAELGRTIAAAGLLPRGWSLAPGAGTYDGCACTLLTDLQSARLKSILAAPFTEFEATGLLALERHDHPAAIRAARASAAYALALLGEPLADIADVGATGLANVARMAERIGAVAGDTAMRTLAAELNWAIAARRGTSSVWGLGQNKLMADPVAPAGWTALGDSGLRPSVRGLLLDGIVGGICLNPREVFFGPSPARIARLDSAAAALRDLPRIDDLIAWQRRRLAKVAAMDRAARTDGCAYGSRL